MSSLVEKNRRASKNRNLWIGRSLNFKLNFVFILKVKFCYFLTSQSDIKTVC